MKLEDILKTAILILLLLILSIPLAYLHSQITDFLTEISVGATKWIFQFLN